MALNICIKFKTEIIVIVNLSRAKYKIVISLTLRWMTYAQDSEFCAFRIKLILLYLVFRFKLWIYK